MDYYSKLKINVKKKIQIHFNNIKNLVQMSQRGMNKVFHFRMIYSKDA